MRIILGISQKRNHQRSQCSDQCHNFDCLNVVLRDQPNYQRERRRQKYQQRQQPLKTCKIFSHLMHNPRRTNRDKYQDHDNADHHREGIRANKAVLKPADTLSR